MNTTAEKLWDIWKDVANTTKWVEGVQQSEITSENCEGEGLSWKEGCLFGSLPVEMNHTVQTWKPAKKTVVATSLPMGGSMSRTTEFKQVDEGCEICVSMEWNLGMASAFVTEEKAQEMMEGSLEQTLINWKKRAESS